MAANLSATFKLVDEMSEKFDNIASTGEEALSKIEETAEAADSAFGRATSSSANTVQAVDGVAMSIENYGNSVEAAASSTDYWTEAVGNYDKSALEALYTTEELIDMGMKSADALSEQQQMFELCERSAEQLTNAMEAGVSIQDELSNSISSASDVISEIAENEKVSANTKEELAQASNTAAEAMRELEAAQVAAQQAMDEYDAILMSGTNDLSELEAAAEKAGHAAENLAEANEKASNATEELSKATDKATEESDKAGQSGMDAINGIAGALAAAGITATVKEIAEAVYELVSAFSEAESIIVKATGATGEALDGLSASMLSAYASAKDADLNSTAGAIGEINTRMGLTGDVLTDVTGKFLDYASITGSDVVGSVQNVTKIMNKWGVEGSNVESVLDKLSYAGQISGASVDNLSNNLITGAASFQEIGLSLDSAISMLAQFELYGMSGTTAITAMRTAVKNFTDDGLNAESALKSVINEIANAEDAAYATALATETFGSRAGVDMANAIRNGVVSVDMLSSSLDEADGTLKKTAVAAQTLDQKWTQAGNNINTAFTSAVQPTLEKVSSGFAELVNGIGDFLNEHPIFTKALTALGVGLGVVAIGIAGVSVASLKSIPAIAGMGTAIHAALGPIGWVALGITAVTAAVLTLSDVFKDETEGMTAVTRNQYYELQDLNAEYEEACEKYGETSEEASRLKYQVDDLTEAFEANRQTVEEFVAEVDELCSSVDEVSRNFQDGVKEINANEMGTFALIQKFEDLASQTELTAAEEKALETVTKQLSETYPELGMNIDNATENVDNYVAAMKRACEQEAEKRRQEQANESYIEALQKQAELAEEIAKAEANLNAARESYGMYYDEQLQMWVENPWARWITDIGKYEDALDDLLAAQEENDALLAEIEQKWQNVADAQSQAMENATTDAEAVSIAYEEVKFKIDELALAYDEAYKAAYESFQGQFGLFDEAQASMDATVSNAQAALDSQLKYWDNYLSNVEVLKNTSAEDLGITQDNYELLMNYVRDGSEEAAGLAQSLVNNINSGNEEAVAKLADTAGKVQEAQEKASAIVADWVTDFSNQMDEIEKEMQETVDGLDLSNEAAKSAKNTISKYADEIRNGGARAVEEAQKVANKIKAALNVDANININASSSNVERGYAIGTLSAVPGLALVGENGPELINFAGGEVVYTAKETAQILDDSNNLQTPQSFYADVPSGIQESRSTVTTENLTKQEKKILLEIAGQGSIDISNGVDKDTVIDILYNYLKPVLADILKQETYEEGELVRDY